MYRRYSDLSVNVLDHLYSPSNQMENGLYTLLIPPVFFQSYCDGLPLRFDSDIEYIEATLVKGVTFELHESVNTWFGILISGDMELDNTKIEMGSIFAFNDSIKLFMDSDTIFILIEVISPVYLIC